MQRRNKKQISLKHAFLRDDTTRNKCSKVTHCLKRASCLIHLLLLFLIIIPHSNNNNRKKNAFLFVKVNICEVI